MVQKKLTSLTYHWQFDLRRSPARKSLPKTLGYAIAPSVI